MRHIIHKIIFLCTTIVLSHLSSSALPTGFFASESRLAKGNWVKITTGESGIYEISYDNLRQMGFSNPDNVGVYGRGGAMLNENFTDASGNPLYTDDIQPVPVLHRDNKIYFYAQGPSLIRYRSESAAPASRRFERQSINIYSETGTYFLSQNRDDMMEIKNAKATEFNYTLPNVTKCWDYIYHERDLVFNENHSGQQFWGESLLNDRTLLIPYELPNGVLSEPASLECRFVHHGDNSTNGTKVAYGFEQSPESMITANLYPVGQYNTYTSATPYSGKIDIPDYSGNLKIEYRPVGNPVSAYLDYILLGYQKEIRFNEGENQFRAFIPDYNPLRQGYVTVANATPTTVVWDITSPQEAVSLPVLYANGLANAHYMTPSKEKGLVMVFDTSRPQKKITSYESADNQNLHGISGTPDMLIITTDERKTDAETLADLHRNHDGMEVEVVTSSEVINEFSGGTPDAMAYRGLAKMLYDRNPGKLHSILLFGPILADNRQITRKADIEMLISYQSEESDRVEHTYAINDFHGYMKDYYPSEQSGDNLYMRPLDVAVAILPVRSGHDAEIMISKTAQAITDDSYAYWLGTLQFIGDAGDENQHTIYSDNLAQDVAQYSDGAYVTRKICIDGYPIYKAKERLIRNFTDGCLFSVYFGHGDVSTLSGSGTLWNNGDLTNLHNRRLGFFTVAGCNVTKLDNNFRGAAEKLVFADKSGIVGGLLTNRVGWSQQNWEFVRRLQNAIYLESPDNPEKMLSTPRTIGECYTLARSRTFNSNKFIYQLMADPALILPVPTATVKLTSVEGKGVRKTDDANEIVPGSRIDIAGHIESRDGERLTDFNGKAVVSIYDNAYTEKLANYISKSADRLDITFDENLLALTETEVIDGEFSTSIVIPSDMNQHQSELPATIRISAYNPDSRHAALGSIQFKPGEKDSSVEEADEQSPEITEFYINTPDFRDGQTVQPSFTVHAFIKDDLSINMQNNTIGHNIVLELDGKRPLPGMASFAKVMDSGREVRLSIPVDNLTTGQHTLTLTVYDNSGKSVAGTIAFNVSENICSGRLSVTPCVITDKATIAFEGEHESEAELIITDPDGNTILRTDMNSGDFEWDATDSEGRRVNQGIYSAYCLLKGKTGNSAFQIR